MQREKLTSAAEFKQLFLTVSSICYSWNKHHIQKEISVYTFQNLWKPTQEQLVAECLFSATKPETTKP